MKTNWVERLWIDGPFRVPFQRSEIKFFQTLHPLERPARALEIGCGRGVGARLILESFAPERLDAIDIDPDMIKRAMRRADGRVYFQVADAESLPFADASMDAVFNFGIIHHLEDWERGIREIARVLKPGGAFYFEEIYPALYAGPVLRYVLVHPRENRFDGDGYRSAIRRAGLELVSGYHESRYTIVGAALNRRAAG